MSPAAVEARLRHIPTSLITGYPGAGKTGAILGLLAQRPEGERWAVLVNNFGQTGIEGGGYSGAGSKDVTVSEVAGGCICCSAKLGLRVALLRLLRKSRPQRLLIEAAGLAHPAAVLDTLRDPWLSEVLDLRATICVADPRQFADPLLAASEAYLEQLALADIIVAGKAALATPAQLRALFDYAGGLHPAKLRTLPGGDLPLEWLDLAPAPRSPMAAQGAPRLSSTA